MMGGDAVGLLNRAVQLVSRLQGSPRLADFGIVETPLPALHDGDVLVKNEWTSVDAALLLRLHTATPEGYLPPLQLHQPLAGLAVGEVLESNSAHFVAGDLVSHIFGYRDYAIVNADGGSLAGVGSLRWLDRSLGPSCDFLGTLGHIGLTAYVGLVAVAKLRPGDVVWVSSAAGATGSTAAQIAKLLGHTVIGSAGSADKVAYLREDLGLDAAFNYKDGDLRSLLHAAAPDGIDVYFDNVGGKHLEAALYELRAFGRVALCGALSEYNGAAGNLSNTFQLVVKNLSMRGFRAGAHASREAEAQRVLGQWVREGKLKLRTAIFEGLESAAQAIVAMSRGHHLGKTLIRMTIPS